MPIENLFEELQSAAKDPNSLEITKDPVNLEKLVKAPASMDDEEIKWTPPPSYLNFLQKFGYLHLGWHSKMLERRVGVYLFDPDEIGGASEIVYMPPGVSMDDDEDAELSTNHLIPFAGEPGEEWAFCFDASGKGAEYPIYYHHQDTPRARLKKGGKWHDSTSEKPDFANFEEWLKWLAEAVEKGKDPEFLGQPWRPNLFK